MKNFLIIIFLSLSFLISFGPADAVPIEETNIQNLTLGPVNPTRARGFWNFFSYWGSRNQPSTSTLSTLNADISGEIVEATLSGTWSGSVGWRDHVYLYLGDTVVGDISSGRARWGWGIFALFGRRGTTINNWSYNFSEDDLVTLNNDFQDGSVVFRRATNRNRSLRNLRLGTTTLRLVNESGNEITLTFDDTGDGQQIISLGEGMTPTIDSFEEPIVNLSYSINDQSNIVNPEPSTMLLLGSGLIGLLGYGRRKFFKK
jgi:hypothetical protein